jgi:hypothetical protein
MDTSVWPIPKELTWRSDALPLPEADVVVPARARGDDLSAAQLFADLIADDLGLALPVVRGAARPGRLPIEFRLAGRPGAGRTPRDLPGAEGYLLRITAQGAQATGRDARGAQHAAATMIQLVERRGRQVVLRGAEVRDWPHKPVRMVHLYLPGSGHLGYARRYLRDFLVRYKFNGLFIELGGGTRLRGRPEIAVAWRRFADMIYARGDAIAARAFTALGLDRRKQSSMHQEVADGRYLEPDELARLFERAREYHLEPVPEIQSLTHAYYLASAHREIAEIPGAQFPDAYCPSDPKSYEILFDVMSEYVALTKCRSVHIGHDEWRTGGQCPRCRARDTGELFAEDVTRIVTWLKERGLCAWMWGDHLLAGHNAEGVDLHEDGVWYNYPQTRKAAGLVKELASDITVLNWSWWGDVARTDQYFTDLGFQQIYGNLDLRRSDAGGNASAGRRFYEEWPVRSSAPGVLGGETSSWSTWGDFELGRLHYPSALYSANLLWSRELPPIEEAEAAVARQLPRLRDRMRRLPAPRRLWSVATPSTHKHPVSIRTACNVPFAGDGWDLSGLRRGRQEHDGLPFEIVDPADNGGHGAVVVARGDGPGRDSTPISVGGTYASLIFWQVATGAGDDPVSPYNTAYPREGAELLGWYEIRYADGLTRAAEVRFDENVRAWNDGHALLYHAHEVPAGQSPDGRPLLIWGLEWTNPRPSIPIESVTLHGARPSPDTRPQGRISEARPMLLGITAVELPRLGDY